MDAGKLFLNSAEAFKLLGFSRSSGYAYLAHLEKHGILKPVWLPALKTPRWRMSEVEALAQKDPLKGVPEFKAK